MNKYFYDLGKRLLILVTASSNVHYLDENEDIIRSILLYGMELYITQDNIV